MMSEGPTAPADNVVDFVLAPGDDAPVVRKRRDYVRVECEHKRIEVDDRERTVTCKVCDKKVDPVSALLMFADYFRHVQFREQAIADFEKREREKRDKKDAKRRARSDYCAHHDTLQRFCRRSHEWAERRSELAVQSRSSDSASTVETTE